MNLDPSDWHSLFSGLEASELPLDHPRLGIQSFTRDDLSLPLDDELTSGLVALAEECRVSLHALLCTALGTLLLRYTDQGDIAIGTLIRSARLLPLRLDLDPGMSVPQAASSVAAAIGHVSSSPEAAVLEWWRRQADEEPSRAPLFQVMLIVVGGDAPGAVTLGDVDARRAEIDRCDAVLVVRRGDHGTTLECEYDIDLFEEDSITRHLEHLRELLRAFVADPSRSLAKLPLLTAHEAQLLLEEWNATGVDYPQADCLHRLFEGQVARTPDATALVFGDHRLTWCELNERADALARHLRGKGVAPESLVGVFLERSIEMVVALYGILKAGAAYVPLDPDYPAERLQFMIDDAGIGMLLTTELLLSRLPATDAALVCLDRDRGAIESAPTDAAPDLATLDDLAYVIFTSGSTGRPKGVMNAHRGICNRLLWMQDAYQLDSHDSVLQKTPFSFDVSVWEFFWPLLVGARLVIAPPGVHREAAELIRLIRDAGITTLHFVPSMLQLFLEEPGVERCTTLKRVICSGEALPHGLQERFFRRLPECELHNLYGPTEAAVDVSSWKCRRDDAETVVPIGRPIANTSLYILNQAMQPVPVGVPGELHIGGVQVARGYLNRDELTRERFVPDPFRGDAGARLYKTGDLARYRPDGNIEFLGRIDDQVKIRGLRVELGEIEHHLRLSPEVRDCVVVVREETPGDQRLIAYVVGPRSVEPDVAELAERLRKSLPEYMVPAPILCLPGLPLSPNGKIDRGALPSPDSLRPAVGAGPDATRSRTEATVAGIWAEVLGLSQVGLKENFFDLGGHSILVARVRQKVEEAFGTDLPMAEFFKHTTVEALAKRLDGGAEGTRPQLLPHRRRAGGGASEIAIVGMACRLPGAKDVDSFWENLQGGVESITFFSREELLQQGIPLSELEDPDYVPARAVLDEADCFDAEFFGYSPREAEVIDPQQRVFLECAWHALEDAGYGRREQDLRVGVYAGAGMNTYLVHNLHQRASERGVVGAFQVMISNDKDFLPTRVSYKLNLKGPSVNVQTACSTSLVAIHTACRALAEGECQMAIAGGSTVHVPQVAGYQYQEGMILASDGHCRAFDAKADGTVFGSGVAAVVLKRLDEALAAGDQIHAVIKGSAINNDGAMKIGYTAPSVEGQASVIASAHAEASVSPDTIGYVEAHGTGTSLGDPIEIEALTEAFRSGTDRKGFCGVGSVKTNIGHVDAAAGVTGLIKTVLALKHRALPPSLHFESPNPALRIDESPFYVVGEARPWPAGPTPRRAGVSSFGIGGTNAHVVLEEAPERERQPSTAERDAHLLVLSARSPSVLPEMASRYAAWLEGHPDTPLGDVCFSANTGRAHFEHRLGVSAADATSMASMLRRFAESGSGPGIVSGSAVVNEHLGFLMTGQGSQYVGMGRGLYEGSPVFRAELDRCAEILERHLERPLLEVMHRGLEGPEGVLLDDTRYTQPALFAIEYSLAQLWRSWGVEPTVLLGHSVGEYVAACIAGVFSLEDALKLISHRGRLMSELPREGSMLAVFAPESVVEDALVGQEDRVSLAAVNGPESCVISGAREDVASLARDLEDAGVRTRALNVSHAFHSPLMDAILPAFAEVAARVRYSPPTRSLISNVTGALAGAEVASPEYWCRHVREAVRFSAGMEAMAALGCRVYLEAGPQPTLVGLGRRFITDEDVTWAASLRPGTTEWQQMLAGAAALYTRGVEIDWAGFDESHDRQRVSLPGYPFQRQRHWVEAAAKSELPTRDPDQTILLGSRLPLPLSSETRFRSRFARNTPPYVKDHRVFGILVVAGASHCAMLLMAARNVLGEDPCRIDDVFFLQPFVLGEESAREAQLVVTGPVDGARELRLLSLKEDFAADDPAGWILHLRGNLLPGQNAPPPPALDLEPIRARCRREMPHEEFYGEFWVQGPDAGPSFRWIESVWMGDDEAIARTRLPEIPEDPADFQLHPGVIEACFQVLRACREFESQALLARGGHIFVPFSIGRLELHAKPTSNRLWCYARLRSDSGDHSVVGDLVLADEAGRVLATMEAFECRRLPQETLLRNLHANTRDWLYELTWEIDPLEAEPLSGTRSGPWLVFAGDEGAGSEIAARLAASGDRCLVITEGDAFGVDGEGHFTIDVKRRADYDRMLAEASTALAAAPGEFPFEGVVHTGGDCESALYLVQSLLAATGNSLPRVAFVTRASQQVGASAPSNPEQAQVWGLARVLLLEHPETRCVAMDLDEDLAEADVAALLRDLRAASQESQLAYRSGQRHCARLVRYRSPAEIVDLPLPIRPEATYLVTGGTGGLGRRVAAWLGARGARHLVLSSRSAGATRVPPEVQQLRDAGVRVRLVASDVAREDDLAALLEDLRTTMPPLRGVLHTAGVLDDGMLMKQDWSRFLNACRPKVTGTLNLHRQTAAVDLDFFVCFSSATALLGAPGQGSYAAANAYMDSLMHFRRRQGLPGLSINWGPWGEVGMAADMAPRDRQRAAEQGWSSIDPESGLDVLGDLLRGEATQVGVLPLHWGRFGDALFGGQLPEYLRSWAPRPELAGAPPAAPPAGDARTTILAAPRAQRAELLHRYVTREVADLLGHPDIDPEQGFAHLGMDSLMSVDLRAVLQKGLGVSLASTFAFDHPNVNDAVAFLSELLFDAETENAEDGGALTDDPGRGSAPEPQEELGDTDIDDAIEAELSELESRLKDDQP